MSTVNKAPSKADIQAGIIKHLETTYPGSKVSKSDGVIMLKLPPLKGETDFLVSVWTGDEFKTKLTNEFRKGIKK